MNPIKNTLLTKHRKQKKVILKTIRNVVVDENIVENIPEESIRPKKMALLPVGTLKQVHFQIL